jgi:hypothetical protein
MYIPPCRVFLVSFHLLQVTNELYGARRMRMMSAARMYAFIYHLIAVPGHHTEKWKKSHLCNKRTLYSAAVKVSCCPYIVKAFKTWRRWASVDSAWRDIGHVSYFPPPQPLSNYRFFFLSFLLSFLKSDVIRLLTITSKRAAPVDWEKGGVKQSSLQAFFIWSFSLENSSSLGWENHIKQQ